MKDIFFSSATALASAIREKQVSAMEVLDAHLTHIAQYNPALNAIITIDVDGARQRAQAADAALAHGEIWGPLHGVPCTLKDAHSVAGMRTTAGFEPLKDYIPAKDGAIAARLKSAGAIILGKTNVPVLLGNIQTENPIFGRSNNPWNLERTPGGSSGGACAAVAAGLIPLEIGSDLGGSIRLPASFCGVYGLKPTEHRVSLAGHIPELPGTPRSLRIMGANGPIARCIDDLSLALRIIAGADGCDTDVPPVLWTEEASPSIESLRIAWTPTFPGVPVDDDICHAIEDLAAELAHLGSRVGASLPEVDFSQQKALFWELCMDVLTVFQPQPDGTEPLSLAKYFTALDRRDAFISAWDHFFDDWDVLLCPAAMGPAFEHCPKDTPIQVNGEQVEYWDMLSYCAPFNLTGHPAIVLPLAQDRNHLPIGLQIVGRRWGDERLLAIAKTLSQVTGGYQRPPGF